MSSMTNRDLSSLRMPPDRVSAPTEKQPPASVFTRASSEEVLGCNPDAMPIMAGFSVSETTPSGTLLSPPAHAQVSSRLSKYTAFTTDAAPMVPMNKATGPDTQLSTAGIMRSPAPVSA